MQKDQLRSRVLNNRNLTPVKNRVFAPSVENFDEFLGELVGSNTLAIENTPNRQLGKLGKEAPVKTSLLADQDGKAAFAKAEEVVRAVAMLTAQNQALDLYMGADDYVPVAITVS